MKLHPVHTLLIAAALGAFATPPLLANPDGPEKNHLDAILQRPSIPTPGQITTLDRNSDGQVDVRDLVVFLDGQPIRASFRNAESNVFHPQNSVAVEIEFTKPLTGNVRIEIAGTAVQGSDFAAFGSPVGGFQGLRTTIPVNNALSATVLIPLLPPKDGFRGERRLVLSLGSSATYSETSNVLNRTSGAMPGRISTHTVIIKDAAYQWVGVLNFPRESGFPPSPVHIFMVPDSIGNQDFGTGSVSGDLRFSVEGPRFFAFSNTARGVRSSTGALEVEGTITGSYTNPASGVESQWAIQMTSLPAQPPEPGLPASANISSYMLGLTINGFPVVGVQKNYLMPLDLTATN